MTNNKLGLDFGTALLHLIRVFGELIADIENPTLAHTIMIQKISYICYALNRGEFTQDIYDMIMSLE